MCHRLFSFEVGIGVHLIKRSSPAPACDGSREIDPKQDHLSFQVQSTCIPSANIANACYNTGCALAKGPRHAPTKQQLVTHGILQPLPCS